MVALLDAHWRWFTSLLFLDLASMHHIAPVAELPLPKRCNYAQRHLPNVETMHVLVSSEFYVPNFPQ